MFIQATTNQVRQKVTPWNYCICCFLSGCFPADSPSSKTERVRKRRQHELQRIAQQLLQILPRIYRKGSMSSKFARPKPCRPYMLEACHELHPKPKSIIKLKRCRWSGTACRRNRSTRLLRLHMTTEQMRNSCWQWTFRALKLTVKHQSISSLRCFNDAVLLCFDANIFHCTKKVVMLKHQ